MKPNYKNWVPKGMMLTMLIISAVLLTCFLLFGVYGIGVQGVFRLVLGVLLGIDVYKRQLIVLTPNTK